MISFISIQNFIIIENLEITFHDLFTAITGETGTGKSIVIDAIDFCLGNFQSKNIKKNQNEECIINLCINKDTKITKIIDKKNKTSIYLNNKLTTQKHIKMQYQDLIDITSQFDSILNSNCHQNILDEFMLAINPEMSIQLDDIKTIYCNIKDKTKQIDALEEEIKVIKRDHEYFLSIVDELDKINIMQNEETNLLTKRAQMSKANTCNNSLKVLLSTLHAIQLPSKINSASRAIEKTDIPEITSIKNRLNSISIEFLDIVDESENILKENFASAEELNNIDNRLSIIKTAARKYSAPPNLLFEFLEETKQKINSSNNLAQNLEDAISQKNILVEKFKALCVKIHAKRKKSAAKFSEKVRNSLAELSMKHANFEISVEYNSEKICASGQDDIEFLANFNEKSKMMAFSKIASGGEAARINFAIKMIVGISSKAKTIIFDEIDIGIGGATAYAMGVSMRNFSQNNQMQLISITHSAQVAALSHEHISIQKTTANNQTSVFAKKLQTHEREFEIARMISGELITKDAIATAKHLIKA